MRKSAVVAFKLFKQNVGKVVTPTELETAMNVGPYAGREVWILKKRLGLDISTQKDGRTVTGYVLNKLPETEPELVTAHFDKVKVKSKPKAKKPVAKKVAAKATSNLAKIKAAAEKRKVTKVAETELEAGEVPTVITEVDEDINLAEEIPEFLKRPVTVE